MFMFIAFTMTVLAYLNAVAASPASAPQVRAEPGPTGFNMCVVSTWITMLRVVDSFSS